MNPPANMPAMEETVRADVRRTVRASVPWRMRASIVAADALGLLLALALGYGLRAIAGGSFDIPKLVALLPLLPLAAAFIALVRGYEDLPPHPAEELRRLTMATTMAFVLLVVASFALRIGESYSRIGLTLSWLVALVSVPLCRLIIRSVCSRLAWWGFPIVVLGAGLTASPLVAALRSWPSRGLRPVAILDDDLTRQGQMLHGVPVVGGIDRWLPLIAEDGVDRVVVAMPGAAPDRLRTLWRVAGSRFRHVLVVPGWGAFASLWVEARDLGGQLAIELDQSLLRPSRRLLKRWLDLIAVLAGGLVVAPLLFALAMAVRATSCGPVFYGQRRLGMDGIEFRAWKFRTMRADADAVLAKVLDADPLLRAEWERDHKLRDDPRVTWIGKFLRKTSLDELPQLWNVLVGQMSMVGPRPVTQAEIAKYGEEWDVYLRVRPGITGLWQVSGRNRTTYAERVRLDAFYVHNWSPWLDIVILARTVRTVTMAEGAY